MTALSWTKWNDGSLSLRDAKCLVYARVTPHTQYLTENIQPAGYRAGPRPFDSEDAAKHAAEDWLIAKSKEPIRIVNEIPE